MELKRKESADIGLFSIAKEIMDECIMVLVTHSSYIDVCESFLRLYYKNWNSPNLKILLAVCGKNTIIPNIETVYCGENATLVDCLREAKEKYPAKIYLVFLGDAFISNKVESHKVQMFIEKFLAYDIQYCRLYPQILKTKKVMIDRCFRLLNRNDRYGHSFIAFACTPKYIENDTYDGMTDLEYELQYLKKGNDDFYNSYYEKHVMLTENIFHIIPGIEKGKWDRIALHRLKSRNKDIEFCNRPCITIRWQFYLLTRRLFIIITPEFCRKILKKIIPNKKFFSTSD